MYARSLPVGDLTFLVSGKLWRNSLIMQDLETGTLWSHLTGEALDGELVGTQLEIIDAVQTTWAAWRDRHPDTLLLKKDQPTSGSRYAGYFDDPERTGLFRGQWLVGRLPGKTLVYGLRHDGHAAAVTAEILAAPGPLRVDLGPHTALVERGDDGGVRAWLPGDGDQPTPLDVLEVFWFAWSSFYPQTTVVD